MTRKLNADSVHEIKVSESPGGIANLVGYIDGGGVPTIGWGHTGKVDGKPVAKGMRINLSKAEELFQADTEWACAAVERYVRVDLNDYQFGALASWTLNVGEAQMKKSTLVKKLNNGDYDSVPREFMKWVNDNGKRVPGLVNRRARDAALWAKGATSVKMMGVISSTAQKAPPNLSIRDAATTVGVGASGAGGILGTNDGQTISNVVDSVSQQQYELTSGDWMRIAVAVVIVAGMAYALYRKWKSE